MSTDHPFIKLDRPDSLGKLALDNRPGLITENSKGHVYGVFVE